MGAGHPTAYTPLMARKRYGSLHAYQITPEHKAEFLELLYAGLKPNQAAERIGTTGTVFRRLRSPHSQSYDPDFSTDWELAERSEEHRRNREDHLRAMIDERSEVSDAMLKLRALAELPEYEVLRQQNIRHDISVELAMKLLPTIPQEALNAAIAEEERRIQEAQPAVRLLPPANDA